MAAVSASSAEVLDPGAAGAVGDIEDCADGLGVDAKFVHGEVEIARGRRVRETEVSEWTRTADFRLRLVHFPNVCCK